MPLNSKFTDGITLPKLVKLLTYLTTAIVCSLTVISLFGRYPFLELSTHFRLQYVWLSLICILALGIFRSWKLGLLITICAIFNIVQIIPYYYPNPHYVITDPSKNLKLMLANVQGNNKNYSELVQAVKFVKPDILVLQEVTENWWENIQELKSEFPNSKPVVRSGGSGLVLFSRYPIESTNILTFDSSTHPALFCVINLEGTLLSILTIHPPTPMRSDKFAYRNGQFAQAAVILKTALEPKLLIGDLNTTMWSPYFTDLIQNSGLRDARVGQGLYPSWNGLLPAFLRVPIDQCLIGDKIEVESIETGNYTGSDHRPLIINLKINMTSN